MAELPINRTRIESAILTGQTSRRRWPELLVIAGLTLLLGATAGPIGIGAGMITAAVWHRFGIPFGLAIGHLLLVVVFPDGAAHTTLLLIELAFFTLVVFPLIRTSVRLEAMLVGAVSLAILLGTSWIGFQTATLWLPGILCVGLVSLGLYLVHRHGLVTLGIIPGSDADGQTQTDTTHE